MGAGRPTLDDVATKLDAGSLNLRGVGATLRLLARTMDADILREEAEMLAFKQQRREPDERNEAVDLLQLAATNVEREAKDLAETERMLKQRASTPKRRPRTAR